MRLSKLHIAGFKSFPDRAELGFDQGVTAIVGPNGCGKSNVVDAITWVLGEQSARSLRGERMEDVIFNGSDARKPTATAEVRLKLTEVAQAAMVAATAQEPDELDRLLDGAPLVTRDIEIGRRLYRSGESEYLIDGEVCRLRDVHDLLMDSGLGVKAYAVIEQGKIGQILSSRPAERRMLIEEAAGVTKYKSRRRMAELKLDAAQGNLTRIDDIVFEVEKQRAALKRQAARARRYRRLREELRTWEQVQFAHRHEALSREIEAADERLADARAKEAAAAARVAELEAELAAVRLGLTEAEAAATAAREAAHARELEIGRAQQQVLFDRQQIEDLAGQAARFDVEARELEDRRGPSADALTAQRDAAARAGQSQADIVARVAARTREYEAAWAAVQTVEQESDAARATVLSSATTLSALDQARENAAAVRDRVAAERERLDLEARDLATEADRARRDREAADAALAEVRARGEAAAARQAAAEKDLAGARERRERLVTAVGARGRDLAGREARLRSLQELDASRATFGDAARLLLGDTGAALRRHGAVADHLRVDRSYERAVDALLGDLLQHVLVEDATDAQAGLALLTAENAGRGGFVVLAAASVSRAADGPLVVPPGARALSDVAHPSGPHANAIARLVGHALIVESFAAARDLARTVDVPVAALTGEVFRGAWLVQGGSRQDVRGILETRAEVATLADEVREVAADVAALTADRDTAERAIAAGESAAEAARDEWHECEKVVVGLEAEAARAAAELDRVTRRLDVVSTERGRAAEEHASAEGRRADAAAAIVTHETHQRDAETSLGGVLGRLQAAREETEARLRLLTESRAEQAALTERVSALDAEVARLEEAARDLEARIDSRRADIRRTEERREELRVSIASTERKLDEDIRAVEALKVDMRGVDARVGELREAFNAADHTIRAARHAQDGVRSHVMELELARARAVGDLAHLAEACFEAIGASIDEVVTTVAALEDAGTLVPPQIRTAAAEEDEEAAEEGVAAAEDAPGLESAASPTTPDAIIALLRAKIERLGPVNMMAIEQFDELESRHTFLTTQRKDLLDSISQTGDAIRKIDKTTRERFAEAFESINVHFEKTFTTLFGGGRAGLLLIDQDNDTESGIDIIAQPPGKRLQNVQLLSGGEKALTAMALMFAIFKHRPSPFCLLDEIDAPLDDANIGRFIEMLQGMQDHTQFILITHNRKTMEIANRLYGVTMEEPGVSKLISLQLN